MRRGLGLARCTAATLALTLAHAPASAVTPDEAAPLSPRNASYTIEASLDTGGRMIRGRQIVTWRNVQAQPTGELWFHLYWNAWRNNRSTWLQGERLADKSDLKDDTVGRDDWSWIEVESIALVDPAGGASVDLNGRKRYASPDDGNPDDRTVMVVDLPRPIPPGGTAQVEMTWTARVPRTFDRTGYRGDYYFIAHWFPKLGVYEGGGWNCHQFHVRTEFFSDYGSYDVRLTLPRDYVLGATGLETGRSDNADGTVTHRYRQDDVHEFAWTASPDYLVREARFEHPGLPPIDMRLLIQPEHLGQAGRHFAAARAAFLHYGTWYGPYPYGHVTLIDPAWGSGAGGMEYPTLFTCGTRLFNPFRGDSPESVTVHEAGHQFWYGMTGNNEFEHAWLDEGLNEFTEGRAMDAAYPPRLYVRRYLPPPTGSVESKGFLPVLFPGITMPRIPGELPDYRKSADSDVMKTPSYRYFPVSAYNITYSKTALWLATLERYLGWERLQKILSTFFARSRFRHPTPEEFFATAREVSGQDLDWYFDQVYGSAVTFDYLIQSVSSTPVTLKGMIERDGTMVYVEPPRKNDGGSDTIYRTEVAVQRRGDGWFPVDILLVFEDGEEIRRRWDGRERWTILVEERAAKLRHAIVDPERVLLLDLDPGNNSRRLEPAATLPAVKWASKWIVWLQDYMAAFTFFM